MMQDVIPTAVRAAFVFLLTGFMFAASCESGDPDLKINSVSPERVSARGGETLIVKGRNFKSGVSLYLGDKPLEIVDSTADVLTAITPVQTAGVYDVTVKVPAGASATMRDAVEVEPLALDFREAASHYLPNLGDVLITDVATVDLNGDGAVDILLAISGGQSKFLLNDGAGGFSDTDPDPEEGPGLPVFIQDTRALVVADFDGDGSPDIFGCSGSGEPNRLLLNDGAGRFHESDGLPPRVGSCIAAAAADLDGDGLAEIVVIAAKEENDDVQFLRVYRNLGAPGNPLFEIDEDIEPWTVSDGEPVHSFSGDTFSSISAADLDGDGAVDLVLTANDSPTGEFLRVLLNRRTVDDENSTVLRFVQQPVVSPPDPVTFSTPLDVESSGDMDLLLLTQGQNRVFINDGNAHFFDDTTAMLPVDRTDSRCAATGDLNLDGFTDVVIANYGQADRLYVGTAEGRMLDFTPSLGLEPAHTRFAVILDADGDGVLDILTVNDGSPRLRLFISVWVNDG